jgi:uncharacterized protein YkwD
MRLRVISRLASPLVVLWVLSPWAGGVTAAAHVVSSDVSGVIARPDWTTAAASAAVGATSPATAPVATEDERMMVDLINTDRARYGLAPLELDIQLLEIARLRAAAQASESRLSHYDAAGQVALRTLLDEAHVLYTLAGENLARLDASSSAPQSAQEALMQSREHRDNILTPAFNRLAVGVVRDASGRVTFAEIFRAVPCARLPSVPSTLTRMKM